MAGGIAAKRHAQALFEIAKERGKVEEWKEELGGLVGIAEDPELLSALEDPRIDLEEKLRIVNEGVRDLDPLLRNFLFLLIARRRLKLLPEIAEEYRRLADEYLGFGYAEITTAVPLSDEEKELIAKRLSEIFGKKIILATKVDPEILGGFVARIGDLVIDGSVKGRFEQLREALLKAGT